MANLATKYMGLNLRNPIIIGSSGLTDSVENIRKLDENGAGAIVLKSLFEEQILLESHREGAYSAYYGHPDTIDYIKNYKKDDSLGDYIDLIKGAKSAVDIPIIASINCISADEWVDFAVKVEEAGADALELNISLLPSDESKSSSDNEKLYFDIIKNVRNNTRLPLSIKMSYYSSGLARLINKIEETGNVGGMVLFNRYYNPDIDIKNIEVSSSNILSSQDDIANSLRWIAIMSGKTNLDLVAATGIHDGKGVIKQILAGAKAVQIVSTLYNNNIEYLNTILNDIENWMDEKRFDNIESFRAIVSYAKTGETAGFERIQFMKYYGGIE